MAFILTPDQRRTLDLSTHLSVTANAGAGKTSVLARRFVEIFLGSDARLPEVVAITFTEQAAGELRKRIHDVILSLEGDPGLRAAGRARLVSLRNQLSSAVIGTIHSFCARLLRMYPAEADIDASFGVVEGQERARLVAESISETFADFMGRGDGAGPSEEFRDLLRAVPPARLERFLGRMFSQREQLHRLFTGRRAGPQGVEDPRGAGGEDPVAAITAAVARRAAESGWPAMARETARAAGGKDASRVLEILGGGEGEEEEGSPLGPERMAGMLAGTDGLIFTKDAGFRKSFLGNVSADSLPRRCAEYLREFESRYAGILRALRSPDAPGKIRAYDRLAAALEEVFLAAEDRYRMKKDEMGVLDFEDLQIMTRELLGREGTRERIRSDYRYLLVDEFQDTNDLQYGILKDLLDGFRRGNLFIVGDPKQSIYGFRNADVGVFYDAREEIAAELRRSGADPGDGGSVVLQESFRPLPAIAAFVNAVFSVMMVRGGSRFGVDYNRIVAGREPTGRGEVEMLLVPAPPESDRAASVRAECALLAGRLREIAAEGSPSGYSWGECAVLLRDRTNLPALEKAFEEAGIPYLLAGGVGFFQTQEIYDFLNYLKFLVSTDDDPALAGILRSPFYGLTDAELYEISLAPAAAPRRAAPLPGGVPLREKLRLSAELPGAPWKIRRAERLLAMHAALADRIPVPRLLRRIAADTGWMGTMAGLSHGPQHRENFLKLLELARNRAAGGPVSLYDFAVYLDGRAEEEEREGQAAASPGGRAVRVMTIHAAKGLEFPVVFLPFLDRSSRPDHEPIIDPGSGIGFRPGGGENAEEEGAAPRYDLLRALSEEKRIAEEKRVFYVGCTRAKDILVLSAAEREKPPRNSPLGWLKEAMAAAGAAERGGTIDFGDQRLLCLERRGGMQRHAGLVFPLTLRVRRPGEVSGALPAGVAAGRVSPAPRILTGPLSDTSGGEAYPATRLAAYMTCPALYYLRYVLGTHSPEPERTGEDRFEAAPGESAASPVRRRAALEGELTHRILSELSPPVREESIAPGISALAASLGAGPGSAELEARAAAHVYAFLRSDAGREILSGRDARTEFQISALLGDAVVMGKIDRLWRGRDGLMEFVDYKTDAVTAAGTASMGEGHRPQIAVYAYLISRLASQEEVRGTVLFLKAPSEPVLFRFGPEDLAGIGRNISGIIDAIRKCRFEPPAVPCGGCPGARAGRCPVVPPRH